MAETASKMISLETPAMDFRLLDTCTNKERSLQELKSDIATVIMFICNHCPYVKHIQAKLIEVANHYQNQGIQFIAICSNDATAYPLDSPIHMQLEAQKHHYPFPYLHDATQEVAIAYDAACTPDFYIFDKDLLCIYRGRFDDSTPNNQKPVTGKDLCNALDNILSNQPISAVQFPSLGCNIKWKKK